MKHLVLLLLPALASAQCDSELPSGKACGADDFFSEADPEACSMFYDCKEGCVDHLKCPPMPGNLPAVYDEQFDWCNYRADVDCGSRPCTDNEACATTTRRPTTTTEPDCGHPHNCEEWGDGYFADPFNCRKYWHCYKDEGEHFLCPDDPATGAPEVFDLTFGGCNFQAQTECGDRPICDECDDNCVEATTPATTESGCNHPMDCTDLEDGYYADEWNCRKYWKCAGGKGQHMMCEDDLLWKTENGWCDFPINTHCGDRPMCDECDHNCVTQPPGPDCGPEDHHPADICKGRPPGYFPDMFNCIKYWVCNGELGTHMLCPEGQAWDAVKGDRCDWLDSVECGERPVCDVCDEHCQ